MEGGGEKFRMEKEKGRESNRQGRREVECYQEEEGDDEKVVRKVQRKG